MLSIGSGLGCSRSASTGPRLSCLSVAGAQGSTVPSGQVPAVVRPQPSVLAYPSDRQAGPEAESVLTGSLAIATEA